jgi:integrase
MKFIDYAQQVLEQRAKDGVRGIRSERHRFRVHVSTAPFATKDVTDIRPTDIVAWSRLMAEKKARDTRGDRTISSATVRRSMAFASAVFSVAVEDGLINVNPCFGVRARRHNLVEETRDKWAYLTREEQIAILRCPDIPEPERLTILFALYTGVRQGEQFNLELRDLHVDDDDPHVYVRFGSPGLPPKNGKIRKVPLFTEGLRAARQWLEMLPEWAPHNPDGLVFPTRTGKRRGVGKPLGRIKVAGKHVCAWKHALRLAGIKRNIRWHDLRHSCASSLLAGWWGRVWTTEEIRELLGHSSIKISERYAHLGEDSLRRAARETGAVQVPTAPTTRESPVRRYAFRALRSVQQFVARAS